MCVCVRARARASVRVCVCLCVSESVLITTPTFYSMLQLFFSSFTSIKNRRSAFQLCTRPIKTENIHYHDLCEAYGRCNKNETGQHKQYSISVPDV